MLQSPSDFITADLDNRNDDVLVDYDALVFSSRTSMTRSSPQVLPVFGTRTLPRMNACAPPILPGGSYFNEQKPKRSGISSVPGIVCPTARQNQASGNRRALQDNDFRRYEQANFAPAAIGSSFLNLWGEATYRGRPKPHGSARNRYDPRGSRANTNR